jgi:NTP pyrophosphatase (non-canonical NTP hydrolase)
VSKEQSAFQKHLDEIINPCWNFAGRCDTHKDEVMNAVLGLGGESGEIVDQVKKMYYHTQKPDPFHREKIISELGDSFFYHIKFMELLGITLEECLEDNRRKLESRHPELGVVTERFGTGYIK